MAWGTPTDPVSTTVITVAYAVANILDPLRWLRTMTGNADPPANNYVVVSTSTTGTSWQKVPTDAIADDAITSAKIAAGAVGKPEIADAAVDVNQLALLAVTTPKISDSAVTTAKIADANVTAAKLATDAVETAKIKDLNVTTAKINTAAVTNDKLAADAVQEANILNGAVSAVKLAAGVAASNLGYTPSNIASGTYTGNGSTSGRQITTGFVVRFVWIHDSANDTAYVAVNVTNSIRLGPSPNFVQGSSSVHVHGTDGFTVGDGTAQGNVNTNSYSYTAFG